MQTKIVFKLVATNKSIVKNRTQTLYTYISKCGEYGVQFHSHPTRSFCYIFVRTHNLTRNGSHNLRINQDAIINTFVERSINRDTLGGYETAIGTLPVTIQ